MTEPLHLKYRPTRFADVIGQGAVVASLEKLVKRAGANTYLLSGPSGCGKTTLAYIAAAELGCAPSSILDIDAATHTGIDKMRELQDTLLYRGFGENPERAIIIDEAHGLSRQAWDSLLKVTEKPPPHIYWFFCTTAPGKIPTTIKTRCAAYELKPVPDELLGDLYDFVCDGEAIKLPGDVGDLIIKEANGSPRQMLVNLAVCMGAKNKKQAAELLRTAQDSDATRELCRFLMAGGSWAKAMTIVGKLVNENPESVRIVVQNYMAAVARNAASEKAAAHALTILDAFCVPYNPTDGQAPLLLSIGRVLMG